MKWIRNRVTEIDLQNYLASRGFDGQSAEFAELELAAIERPGWLQIFVFDVRVLDSSGNWQRFLGVCRDDERHSRFDVELFDHESDRDRTLEEWSEGLITGKRASDHWVKTALLALFLAIVFFALLGAVISNLT